MYIDEKRKLVAEYLYEIINTKTNEQYKNKKKDIYFWIELVWRRLNKKKNRSTLSPRKTPTDFLLAMRNQIEDIPDTGKHINKIVYLAGGDKNVLEECENDLQEVYKIHIVRATPVSSLLWILIFFITIFVFYELGVFQFDGTEINIILPYLITRLTAVTVITQIIVLIFKFVVEHNHVASTSAYEYCVKLLKNAKLRVDSPDSTSSDPATKEEPLKLNRISINPNRMNGQPCIRDLRLTVSRVVEIAQTYPDRSELYREFPDLTEEDIRQAIIYAEAHSQDLIVTPSIAYETLA